MTHQIQRLRLMIVDDSELVRLGLRTLLEGCADIEIVGEAATAAAAVTTAGRVMPQVVLLDIRLPDGSGVQVCKQLLHSYAGMRVLFLTSTVEESVVDDAIRAGAHGYLLKEIDGKGLLQAVRDVAAGRSILDPLVTARVMSLLKGTRSTAHDPLDVLSPQERRVLAEIAKGLTNKEVGLALGLSEKTVKNYLANIFDKLQVTRRAQAAALFSQHMPS